MTVTIKYRWNDINSDTGLNAADGGIDMNLVALSDDPANDDERDVYDALIAQTPANYFGYTKDRIIVGDRLSDNDVEAYWDCQVTYVLTATGGLKPLAPEETTGGLSHPVRYSIRNGTGESKQLYHSKALIAETTNVPAYNFSLSPLTTKLLNIQPSVKRFGGNGKFAAGGIPITLGTVEVLVETVRNNSEITAGYLVTACDAAGRQVTNNTAFLGFPAKTLRLVDYGSNQRASDDSANPEDGAWDVAFSMLYSPNIPAAEIETFGMPEFVADKGGHEIVDYMFIDQQVTLNGNKWTLPVPARCAMHRIYDEENFSTLLQLNG